MEAVATTKKFEVGSWGAGCLAALIFVGGLVYWNEVVIPRQAVDDMCEARYSEEYSLAEGIAGEFFTAERFYKKQTYELNKCKVQGYARLNGSK